MSKQSTNDTKVSSGSGGVKQKNAGLSSTQTPTTAYGFFRDYLKASMAKAAGPNKPPTCPGFTKHCSELWKRMNRDEKQRYFDMARNVKDPNAPKKPRTTFFLFCNDFRPLVQTEKPKLTGQQLSQELGRLWRSLGDSQKAQYEAKYEQEKERYEQEMKVYNGRDKSSKRPHIIVKASSSSVGQGGSLSVGQSVTVASELSANENLPDFSSEEESSSSNE